MPSELGRVSYRHISSKVLSFPKHFKTLTVLYVYFGTECFILFSKEMVLKRDCFCCPGDIQRCPKTVFLFSLLGGQGAGYWDAAKRPVANGTAPRHRLAWPPISMCQGKKPWSRGALFRPHQLFSAAKAEKHISSLYVLANWPSVLPSMTLGFVGAGRAEAALGGRENGPGLCSRVLSTVTASGECYV